MHMNRDTLVVLAVVVCVVCLVDAAPLTKRSRRHAVPEVEVELQDGTRHNALDLMDDEMFDVESEASHIVDHVEAELGEHGHHAKRSRSRRSAVFMMAATMRLCREFGESFCKEVQMKSGDTYTKIKLADS